MQYSENDIISRINIIVKVLRVHENKTLSCSPSTF